MAVAGCQWVMPLLAGLPGCESTGFCRRHLGCLCPHLGAPGTRLFLSWVSCHWLFCFLSSPGGGDAGTMKEEAVCYLGPSQLSWTLLGGFCCSHFSDEVYVLRLRWNPSLRGPQCLLWNRIGILTSHQFLSSNCRRGGVPNFVSHLLVMAFKLFSPGEGTVWVGVAWGRRLWLITCASLDP